jgi:DNA repair protein RadC
MTQELNSSQLRYRLLKEGASKLSDAELLKILVEIKLRDPETATLALTRQLLQYPGELFHLLGAVRKWYCDTQEIKEANEASLKVSVEIQRRKLTKVLKNNNALLFSDLIHHFLKSEFSGHDKEVLSGLFLNQQHQMLGFEYLCYGSIDDINTKHQNAVEQEIVINAERYSATEVIVARNNPSKEASPTFFDIELAQYLTSILSVTSVQLLDHWIIDNYSYISLVKQGVI